MGGSSTTGTPARPALCSMSSAAPEAAALAGMAAARATKTRPETGRGAPLDSRNGAIRSGVLVGVLFNPHRLPRGERIAFDFLGAVPASIT